MPLTPEQQQELKELKRIDELEGQIGNPDNSVQPEEQGVLSKSVDFVTDLPYSAIDAIPGMKQRREDVAETNTQNPTPQPVTGMEDPAYTYGLGFMGPESAASISSKLRNFLKPAAERAEVAKKVKNITELEPYVQGKVNEASELFGKKQIAPRMAEQEARLSAPDVEGFKQTVSFHPQALRGISPELDQYANTLIVSGDRATVPAEEALKIRAMLNKSAGWKMHPTDPAKAVAIDTKVADMHRQIAEGLQEIDPSIKPLSDEMQQAYTLKKQVLGSASKNPVNAVIPSEGVTGLAKKGRLAEFDEQAGTDLSQLGQNIRTAHERQKPMELSDLFSITGPKQLANKVTAPVKNFYDNRSLEQLLAPKGSATRSIGRKAAPLLEDDE